MRLASLRAPHLILAACSILLCVTVGVRATFGLFLQPMSIENGWPREIFSLALALQNLVWGVFGPFAGGIADRHGAGRVVGAGGLVYVAGLVLMAFADTPLTLHLGGGFLIGLALSGTTFATVLAVVARATPPARRGAALGIVTAAASFGQFALLPVVQGLIVGIGWQQALLVLAALVALVLPLAYMTGGHPITGAQDRQSIGEALTEAWRERGFHLLFWGFFVCGFHISMLSVHLPSYVTDAGLQPEQGMTALALIGLSNLIGSYGAGWLGDRFSKKYVLSTLYALRSVLLVFLILGPLTPLKLYVFASGIGLLWLGTVPLTNGLVGQIFGMRYAGLLSGVVFFGHQIGSFIGIWLAGYLYDTTGSYQGALLISIGLGIFAALVHLPVNERPLVDRRALDPA